MWKIMSQRIHMCNMKAISLPVWKLCPRIKFFKSRSKIKVKVKLTAPCEMSCHKEYTCAIWKLYHFWFECYGQGLNFHSRTHDDADARAMALAPWTYLSRLAKKIYFTSWVKKNSIDLYKTDNQIISKRWL